MAENDRLETLLGKMQEVLDSRSMIGPWTEYVRVCRTTLRQAIAELPLIRDEYERKIAELEEIIATAEQGESN